MTDEQALERLHSRFEWQMAAAILRFPRFESERLASVGVAYRDGAFWEHPMTDGAQ